METNYIEDLLVNWNNFSAYYDVRIESKTRVHYVVSFLGMLQQAQDRLIILRNSALEREEEIEAVSKFFETKSYELYKLLPSVDSESNCLSKIPQLTLLQWMSFKGSTVLDILWDLLSQICTALDYKCDRSLVWVTASTREYLYSEEGDKVKKSDFINEVTSEWKMTKALLETIQDYEVRRESFEKLFNLVKKMNIFQYDQKDYDITVDYETDTEGYRLYVDKSYELYNLYREELSRIGETTFLSEFTLRQWTCILEYTECDFINRLQSEISDYFYDRIDNREFYEPLEKMAEEAK